MSAVLAYTTLPRSSKGKQIAVENRSTQIGEVVPKAMQKLQV